MAFAGGGLVERTDGARAKHDGLDRMAEDAKEGRLRGNCRHADFGDSKRASI